MSTVFVLTLQDVLGLAILASILVWLLGSAALDWLKQKLCRHERVFENRACHAICNDCRKDLGFIQTWRDRQKEKAAT